MSQTQTGTPPLTMCEPYVCSPTSLQKWYLGHIIVPHRDRLFTFFSACDSLSDAQKPCSTCVRSHAHALSHAPRGVVLPEHPDCTFDEGTGRIFDRPPAVQPFKPHEVVASSAEAHEEAPKTRYEKLENRISSYSIIHMCPSCATSHPLVPISL